MGRQQALIPAAHSPGFARVFGWYNRRLLRKRFAGVWLARESEAIAATLDRDDRPLVLVLNHSAWWDPLVGLAVGGAIMPSRSGIAPMDAEQLQKFAMFRKLGLFGIDPDDPASMAAMLEYTLEYFRTSVRPTLALTPQGRFVDPREPIVIRPGAAAICSRLGAGRVRCVSLSIEYAFWLEQRPEVFLRVENVQEPTAVSTTSWHRAIESAMRANAATLAELVKARNAGVFAPLLSRSGSAINPMYDLYLRVRGRSASINDRTRPPPNTEASPTRA